jgi:hypothetical protein
MKTIFILILSSSLLFPFQQSRFVKTKVTDGISLLLPEDFVPMSQEDLMRTYLSAKPPVAVYTDYSRSVDFGVNVANSTWTEDDLEIMKSFYKSTIMGLYNEVQFINESIENINGKDFAVFEFVGSVYDEEETSISRGAISKYVSIQYGIVKGKTVLFNFSCPASHKDKWIPIAKEILNSVKISKTL